MTVVVLAHEMPDEYHIFLQNEFQVGFIFSEYDYYDYRWPADSKATEQRQRLLLASKKHKGIPPD